MIKTAKHLEKYTTNADLSQHLTFENGNIKGIFTFSPILIKEHSFLFPFFYMSLIYVCTFKGCRFPILNVSAVAGVVGELRVGAAVGGGVPYVKVHVRPKWVEAGELVWGTSPL